MPVYVFRCKYCPVEWEEYFKTLQRVPSLCPMCGKNGERAFDKENLIVRSDIEPGYNISLGEYVGSRKELREKLAYHNANTDLMLGGNPSAGRLTGEERDIVEGLPVRGEKRSDDHTGIEVEGEVDYGEIRQEIKQRHGWR